MLISSQDEEIAEIMIVLFISLISKGFRVLQQNANWAKTDILIRL